MSYIALLRAINVGGHTVKMERLRELFAELGFARVRTYIQSGNVFFDADETDKMGLAKKIEAHLQKSLGYEVPTVLRTVAEIEELVQRDPFKAVELTPNTRHCVSFLMQPLPAELEIPYITPKGDAEIISATLTEAFVIWHIVDGRPGAGIVPLEKKYRIKTTTRFYHTLIKILEAAKKADI